MPDTPRDVLEDPFDVARLRADGAQRRAALVTHGCRTYTWTQRAGRTAILCLCCGMASCNPHDIHERYCSMCAEFQSEWKED